ncbi:MAG: malto-oligosyltrehalose synthase [Acidimicrobiales bacterium]
MKDPRPLGSTYRLQLNGLGFSGARQLVGYLSDLGIETLYLSPILEAVPGSTHGYDVINPTRLDPALGTAQEFEALLVELNAHDMRALIDIVPNHMACHQANEWWWDTLRQGQGSPFATTFDIDWSRHVGRVLVPILSRPLEDLRDSITYQGEGPERVMDIEGHQFPLAAGTHTGSDLGSVLSRQHYRPSFWRLSNREGNYRRFFDIDGLIGVRVEAPEVFERTHDFLTALADDDRVAGWRVDHVDGLTDPRGYLERLGEVTTSERECRPIVLIEKIVARDESLRRSWRTDGTTGYEFADRVGGLFVNERGAQQLAGEPTFVDLSHEAKREAIVNSFDAALERLARLSFQSLNELHAGHDLSWFDVRRALTELSVSLDVYRTYYAHAHAEDQDRERLQRAARSAAAALRGEGRRAVRLIADVLGAASGASVELVQRWQQLSSAAMAKGAEDTATYRYRGLLSHAEVGCDPDHASYDATGFHEFAGERLSYPLSLSATSTHDSKRSEDARARLFVLSELAEEWSALVSRWQRRYHVSGRELNLEDEFRAYQSFVCLWSNAKPRPTRALTRRVQDYAVKAAREAKCRTSWSDPDVPYERSLRRFVAALASDDRFLVEMSRFMAKISPAAVTNSLATLVLKCVAPGVPDFYQGLELFHYTLTDPDNRRAIDFASRRALLSRLPGHEDLTLGSSALRSLLEEGDRGAIKLYVTRNLLHLRRAHRELFAHGSYQGLAVTGSLKKHAVALARAHHGEWVVACVARQTVAVASTGHYLTGRQWGDTVLRLPEDAPSAFVDVLTGEHVSAVRGRLEIARCLASAPVSVLLGVGDSDR